MIDRTSLFRLAVWFAGATALVAAPGVSRADDPPKPVEPAPPAPPVIPSTPPDPEPSPADDAATVKALTEQVRVQQQRLDALIAAAHQGTAAPTTAAEQSPTPNRAVNAKEAEASPKLAGPPPLTWNGVTLYGTVDVGVAHLSHGAPLSNTYGPSLPFVLQAFSNRPITSLASNGLSQSKLGLSGVEPVGILDLKALFKLETGFQPTSGRLTDGPRSLLDNNGLPNAQRATGGDSGRAGQPFQGAAYVGLGSNTLGTLTIGRQNSLMADGLLKYDPQLQSQAFSPIGYSGTSGGFGDTEDKTLDDSIKYTFAYGAGRAAGLYQFGHKGARSVGSASFDVGVDVAGLSVDFVWGLVRGAIAASSLNAMQAAAAPGTLAATVSDNTGFAAMASYTISPVKLYAGYEHMRFNNPDDPLPNGTVTIGGYVLSAVNNTAYATHKVLQYGWFGARYSITPKLDVSGAYYHFDQNSYATNRCSDDSAGACSGTFDDVSLVVDYRLTRRFDLYAGVAYTQASDGLASGFLYKTDWAEVLGGRFNF